MPERPLAAAACALIVLALGAGTAASAETRQVSVTFQRVPATAPAVAAGTGDVRLAQATAPELGESARRRLDHYGDRVFAALARLAADDASAASGGGDVDADATAALREAIARYVDAADRSGLDSAAAAAFLAAAARDRPGDVPDALRGPDGGLDARALVFSVTASVRKPAAPAGPDYLASVAAEGEQTLAQRRAELGAAAAEAPATASAPEPEAEPEPVDPEVAAVLARIEQSGGQRRLRVERGDTLGLIARAVYGDALLYRSIYAENRDVLRDPNTLRVGTLLALPAAN